MWRWRGEQTLAAALLLCAGCARGCESGDAVPSDLPAPSAAPSAEASAAPPEQPFEVMPALTDEPPPEGSAKRPPKPPANPVCNGADPWHTYGHDAARTSASDSCCEGPVKLALRWTPPIELKARLPLIEHVIGDATALFALGLKGKSTIVHRLDWSGRRLWAYDTRADLHLAYWPTFAHGAVLLNDDGMYFVHPDTGKEMYGRGLDMFGATLADKKGFYATNVWHVEGPGLYVGAFTPDGRSLWKQNKYGSVPMDMMEDLGGVALEGETLYQIANYKFAQYSGVYAFDRETGEVRWGKESKPISHGSVGEGGVFVVEKDGQERKLVARSQRDGERLWAVTLPGLRANAPALADGLVLVDTEHDGVFAVSMSDGNVLWNSPIKAKHMPNVGWATAIAVARPNHALIYVHDDSVTVLSLRDGRTMWDGKVIENGPLHSPVLINNRLVAVSGGDMLVFTCE